MRKSSLRARQWWLMLMIGVGIAAVIAAVLLGMHAIRQSSGATTATRDGGAQVTPTLTADSGAPSIDATIPIQFTAPSEASSATTLPSSPPSSAQATLGDGTSAGEPAASEAAVSGPKLHCVQRPSQCGFPDATNTGVNPTAVLKQVPQQVSSGSGWHWDTRGWVVIDEPEAVFSGFDVAAPVNVDANDVVIRGNRLHPTGNVWAVGLNHVQRAQIVGNTIGVVGARPRIEVGVKDVYGDAGGTQVIRNNIANTSTGVQIHEGLIEGNYIHDMGLQKGDHINGITTNGGGSTLLTIRRNTVLNQFSQTDAVSLFQDFGLQVNRVITGNLLAGGDYAIYAGGEGSFGLSRSIVITNNRISRIFFPNGGYWGPLAKFDQDGPGNVWANNVWDDTHQVIN